MFLSLFLVTKGFKNSSPHDQIKIYLCGVIFFFVFVLRASMDWKGVDERLIRLGMSSFFTLNF